MKSMRILSLCLGMAVLLTGLPALAKTCCEKANEEGKECKNKCCINAHKEKRSCVKCNPNKEDLKLIEAKPGDKQAKKK